MTTAARNIISMTGIKTVSSKKIPPKHRLSKRIYRKAKKGNRGTTGYGSYTLLFYYYVSKIKRTITR